jgi:hypothetical protein
MIGLFNRTMDDLERHRKNDTHGSNAVMGIRKTLCNEALPPEERITQAENQTWNYMRERVSGRMIFPGDTDTLKKQLEQSSEESPPNESADA